jgi:hypothetical protein
VNNHFERSRVKDNEIHITGPKFTTEKSRILRDRTFSRSGVNMLSNIEEKSGQPGFHF